MNGINFEEMGSHRGFCRYKMSKEMAEDLLSQRVGKEKNIPDQKFLCDYVNEEMGLIGYCEKVVIK